MRRVGLWVLAAMALCATGARAQSELDGGPGRGSHEFQVWTTGGHSVQGGAPNTAALSVGARYGWVLTDLHGSGFLRGRFEYAVDAIPVFVIFEPAQTVYGVSFDPFALRWNVQQRHGVMPYAELSGGVLFTNHAVPPGANAVNFTPSGSIGISVPHGRFRWTAELHFQHMSDSNLTKYNPGINLLQLRLGFGFFKKHSQ